MIRHILFITFTENAFHKQIQAVKRAFLQIPNQIDGVVSVEWGINDSLERKNAGFTHCVLMTFQDDAARRRYLPHPAHDELKMIFSPLIKKIIVLDFTILP
ncbi:Stress responsive A/B Barrel Domain [Serratia proteamaculans]|uniref:Dabb family protein n=1 Tax=Serratia proteamaculans TaxID=28151 RepID=UPI00218291AB|nr:Dabb family protein [Serratia proteamaculans]CAI2399303.1 Stress responsive A/B Barrel Domain [Serratia proteamaculans]